MVPDTHSVARLCPGGVMFQISGLQDVRNPVKNTPIHHLQVGSLEDRWFLTSILELDYALEVSSFKFHVSGMSGTLSRTPLSTISRLDPWRCDGAQCILWIWTTYLRCWILCSDLKICPTKFGKKNSESRSKQDFRRPFSSQCVILQQEL